MELIIKSIRTIDWRRQNSKDAFDADVRRLNRLSVLSDERCQFYGWDAYFCWRKIGEIGFAEGIASRLTVAPFSLEHSQFYLSQCLLRPIIPSLVRRLISEIKSKTSNDPDTFLANHEICRIARLVANFSDEFISKEDYIIELSSIPIISRLAAETIVEIFHDQVELLGYEKIRPVCMALKDSLVTSIGYLPLKRQELLDDLIYGAKGKLE